ERRLVPPAHEARQQLGIGQPVGDGEQAQVAEEQGDGRGHARGLWGKRGCPPLYCAAGRDTHAHFREFEMRTNGLACTGRAGTRRRGILREVCAVSLTTPPRPRSPRTREMVSSSDRKRRPPPPPPAPGASRTPGGRSRAASRPSRRASLPPAPAAPASR